MGILEDSKCYATPGYTGFIPSYSDSFGQTYGDITRAVMKNDPCIKRNMKAKMERDEELKEYNKKIKEVECSLPWNKKVTYHDYDDEVTDHTVFPPIPGYQGFITLSKDHFAKSYSENTKNALAEFNYIQKNRKDTYAVQNIIDHVKPTPVDPTLARNAKLAYNTKHDPQLLENTSIYKLPPDHPQKYFIAGYTGFVPHIQNYFGETYSKNTKKAIKQFQTPVPPYDPYTLIRRKERSIVLNTKNPIPGYTGFIPGVKKQVQKTYGSITSSTIEKINKERIRSLLYDN